MHGQYKSLQHKIVLIMAIAAIIPLIILASINYFEFQATFLKEAQTPFRSMVGKTKNSFELFLAERSSTVSLIASIYSYEELADTKTLRRIFLTMQKEFSGFADLGLIDEKGRLVNYAGPYSRELEGVDYSDQEWFHKVRVKNRFISEVFSGFRHFPHMVIAVQHTTPDGQSWVVRATLDTSQFDKLIGAMNLAPGSDAFLLNRDGILQTDSVYYGKALEKLPFTMPVPGDEASVSESRDSEGNQMLLSSARIADTDFVLMAVKNTEGLLRNWLIMRIDLLVVFAVSALCIYFNACGKAMRNASRPCSRWSIRKSCPPLGAWPPVSPMKSTTRWPSSTRRQASCTTSWTGKRISRARTCSKSRSAPSLRRSGAARTSPSACSALPGAWM